MGYLWARIIALAPSRLRRHLGRLLLGWQVHPTAHIGRSVIQVRHLTMGPGTRIGPSNVIRALEELRLEEGAQIGSLNRIIGFPLDIDAFPRSPDRRPALILHPYAAVMRANEIDCSDRVELGEHAVLAGYGSTILTHSYNLVTDQPTASPIEIGHHAMVMSGCMLLNGTNVPPRSIISAGSVVTTKLTKELTFYRGNPAEAVRDLPATLRYFQRGVAGDAAASGNA